ncbi:MAG TPA: hypothetical protein ENK11_01400 [Phycisphaerales bacterium]|nr:hypothetical protein [Phycisphaerales bacterium]
MPETRPEPVHGEQLEAPDVCPYCGGVQQHADVCEHCGAHTDPLSRQATQNEMGPWFIRDEAHPFRPGCRFETIERWVRLGRIGPETVLRGPSTNQHWTPAIRTPGVSRLLGRCHACGDEVDPGAVICAACGVSFEIVRDRQYLGLCPVRALPGREDPSRVASSLLQNTPAGRQQSKPPVPEQNHAPPRPTASPVEPSAERSCPTGPSRLERRVRRAERRARSTALFAGLLVILAVIAVISGRSGRSGPDVPAPSGGLETEREHTSADDAGLPGAGETARPDPDDEIRASSADADTSPVGREPPAESGPSASDRERVIRRLDSLLRQGTADAFAEAARVLDADTVLSDDMRATWRRRLALAREAAQRSALP